ncbi:MAG: ABC transporter permease [Terriglobia bacterium]
MARPTPGPRFWLAVGTLWWRELVRFYRHRGRVVGALGTPLVFWLLIGSGIGTSFRSATAPAEMNYLEYFFPGTVLLILLFTSIFCMMSVIEDRREGFLLSVLVAPVSRASVVLGKTLGGATLSLLQGFLFVLLAPTVGIALSSLQVVYLVGVLFCIAFALNGVGFLTAWRLDSMQGFHAVANLVLIPLWLLSGALFPPSGASPWIRWVMRLNPLTYALEALRHVLYLNMPSGGQEAPSLALALGVTGLFAVLAAVAAFWLAARPSRADWS